MPRGHRCEGTEHSPKQGRCLVEVQEIIHKSMKIVGAQAQENGHREAAMLQHGAMVDDLHPDADAHQK